MNIQELYKQNAFLSNQYRIEFRYYHVIDQFKALELRDNLFGYLLQELIIKWSITFIRRIQVNGSQRYLQPDALEQATNIT